MAVAMPVNRRTISAETAAVEVFAVAACRAWFVAHCSPSLDNLIRQPNSRHSRMPRPRQSISVSMIRAMLRISAALAVQLSALLVTVMLNMAASSYFLTMGSIVSRHVAMRLTGALVGALQTIRESVEALERYRVLERVDLDMLADQLQPAHAIR